GPIGSKRRRRLNGGSKVDRPNYLSHDSRTWCPERVDLSVLGAEVNDSLLIHKGGGVDRESLEVSGKCPTNSSTFWIQGVKIPLLAPKYIVPSGPITGSVSIPPSFSESPVEKTHRSFSVVGPLNPLRPVRLRLPR